MWMRKFLVYFDTREALKLWSVICINLNASISSWNFFNKKINFNKIIDIIEMTFLKNTNSKISNIDDIIAVDRDARNIAHDLINKGGF